MDEWGLTNSRAVEHVPFPRPLVFHRKRQLDGLPLRCGAIQCLNDLDIDEAFQTRRFRLLVVTDTIGKIDEFWRELIAGWKLPALGLPIPRQAVRKRAHIFEGGIDLEASFGPNELVRGCIRRAETGDKIRESSPREPQEPTRHLIHFPKPPVRSLYREGRHLDGIILE